MAADLGDVTIGLVGDTSGLQKAIATLRQFGQEVNRLARSNDEAMQQMAAQYARQEKVISSFFTKVDKFVTKVRSTPDAPTNLLGNITQQVKSYQAALTQAEVPAHKLARAQEGITREMNKAMAALEKVKAEQAAASRTAAALADAQERAARANAAPARRAAVGTNADAQYLAANNAALAKYEAAIRSANGNLNTLRVAKSEFNRSLTESRNQLQASVDAMKRLEQAERQAVDTSSLLASARNRILAANQAVARSTLMSAEAQAASIKANTGAFVTYGQQVVAAEGNAGKLKAALSALNKALTDNRIQMQNAVAATRQMQTEQSRASQTTAALTNAQAKVTTANILAAKPATAGTNAEAQYLKATEAALASYNARVDAAKGNLNGLRVANAQLAQDLANARAGLQSAATAMKQLEVNTKATQQASAALINAQAKVQALNMGAERLRGDNAAAYIRANVSALKAYEQALISTKGQLNSLAVAKANFNRQLVVNRALLANTASTGNTAVSMFRRMEEAAVLSFGPLSGVGARLNIIATMMEQMPLKTFAFLAGMTALVTGITVLIAQSVKAAIAFERWEAQMSVATGTMITVKSRMAEVIDFAQRYGQSLEQVIPAYAKFSASARLAGVSLKDQTALFEASVKAAAALRLPEEGIQRIFLAFEQMAAKGTVMTEEIKRQLGDVLPGAVEIGAKAMNMSLSQFMKALKDQEIKFSEFGPKYAKAMNEIFGPAAEQGARSTQAALIQVTNAWKLFSVELDRTIMTSTLFKNILLGVVDGLKYLTVNVQSVVATLGAFGTGAAVFVAFGASVRAFGMAWAFVGKVVVQVTAAYRLLTAAIVAGEVAMAAGGFGKLVLGLTKLAASAGAAYLAYKSLNDIMDKSEANQQSATVDMIEAQTQALAKVGPILQDTKDEVLGNITALKEGLVSQLDGITAYMEMEAAQIAKANAEYAKGFLNPFTSIVHYFKTKGMKEGLAAAKEQSDALREQIDKLNAAALRMQNLPIATIKMGDDAEADRATENFRRRIKEIVNDAVTAREKMIWIQEGVGIEKFEWLEAMNKAADIVAKLPKKMSEGQLLEMLRGLGVEGKTAAEAIGNLLQQIKASDRAYSDYARWLEDVEERGQRLEDTLDGIATRQQASATAMNVWTGQLSKANKELDQVAKQARKVMEGSNAPDDVILRFVEASVDRARELQNIEIGDYWERELSQIGSAYDQEVGKITERHRQMIETVNIALLYDKISPQDAAQKIGYIMNEMDKALKTSYMKEYFDDLATAVESWRDRTTDAIMEMVKTGKFQFGDLFESIMNDLTRMIVKRGITDPLFEMLFGVNNKGEYTSSGVLGGFLQKFLSPGSTSGTMPGATPGIVPDGSFWQGGLAKAAGEIFDSITKAFSGIGEFFQPIWTGLQSILGWFINAFSATAMTASATSGGGSWIEKIIGVVGGFFGGFSDPTGGSGVVGGQVVIGQHSGGIVGASGDFFRQIGSYHNGGIVGVRPDEQLSLLKKGEEVLTESDPRHRNNMYAGAQPKVTLNVINQGKPLEATQTTRNTQDGVIIDLVLKEVANDIRRNGTIANSMQQQYGLNRAVSLGA